MAIDDMARAFHEEIVKDFNQILANKDNEDLVIRLAIGIAATVITDINRIARANEQIAHSLMAIARVHGSQT